MNGLRQLVYCLCMFVNVCACKYGAWSVHKTHKCVCAFVQYRNTPISVSHCHETSFIVKTAFTFQWKSHYHFSQSVHGFPRENSYATFLLNTHNTET